MSSARRILPVKLVARLLIGMITCTSLLAGCAFPSPPSQSTLVPSMTESCSACQLTPPAESTPGASPVSTAAPTTQVTSIPVPTTTNQPSQPGSPVIPAHYDLDAQMDYYQHTLSVTESITYRNITTETLPSLVLAVEPNLWDGSFNLQSLSIGDGEPVDAYTLQDNQLQLPLPQALIPDTSLTLTLHYTLTLPEISQSSDIYRPQPYGYTSRQTNLVDWYPYIPPYLPGTGWLTHKPWWFGEHQVFDMASFRVRMSLAETVPDLLIAASAGAEQDGDTYTYSVDAARTFALSASTEYVLQTTMVGDVTVYGYFFPYDKSAGEEVLQNTADALKLFSQLILPYPHATLSVVEADFLDGMEYDGLYFLSHGFYDLYDGTPKGYLTFIAAHETAHQWWYGLVGNDQAIEPWLDEALCTYMEHVFFENVYANYPSDNSQSLVDWWWYYRVNFYEPAGWVDGSIYDYSQFRPYRDAVYLNGAIFLDELRRLVGDEAFFAFIKDYARQNEDKIATGKSFFTILRQHTSKDLDPLLEKYFQTVP